MAKHPRKPAELVPVMTRLPEALRKKLSQEAERSGRSMNFEIIRRLEQSFRLPTTFKRLDAISGDRAMSTDERANIAYAVNRIIRDITELHTLTGEQREYLKKELGELEYAHRDLGCLIFLLKRPAVDLREFAGAAE